MVRRMGSRVESQEDLIDVDVSDDEKYKPSSTFHGLWIPAPAGEVAEMFGRLERGEVPQLKWKCPGRRPPEEEKEEEEVETSNMVTEQLPEEKKEEKKPHQPTEFDFDETSFESSTTKITPRRTPGSAKSGKQRRVASMNKVLDDLMKQRLSEVSISKKHRKSLGQKSPRASQNFGDSRSPLSSQMPISAEKYAPSITPPSQSKILGGKGRLLSGSLKSSLSYRASPSGEKISVSQRTLTTGKSNGLSRAQVTGDKITSAGTSTSKTSVTPHDKASQFSPVSFSKISSSSSSSVPSVTSRVGTQVTLPQTSPSAEKTLNFHTPTTLAHTATVDEKFSQFFVNTNATNVSSSPSASEKFPAFVSVSTTLVTTPVSSGSLCNSSIFTHSATPHTQVIDRTLPPTSHSVLSTFPLTTSEQLASFTTTNVPSSMSSMFSAAENLIVFSDTPGVNSSKFMQSTSADRKEFSSLQSSLMTKSLDAASEVSLALLTQKLPAKNVSDSFFSPFNSQTSGEISTPPYRERFTPSTPSEISSIISLPVSVADASSTTLGTETSISATTAAEAAACITKTTGRQPCFNPSDENSVYTYAAGTKISTSSSSLMESQSLPLTDVKPPSSHLLTSESKIAYTPVNLKVSVTGGLTPGVVPLPFTVTSQSQTGVDSIPFTLASVKHEEPVTSCMVTNNAKSVQLSQTPIGIESFTSTPLTTDNIALFTHSGTSSEEIPVVSLPILSKTPVVDTLSMLSQPLTTMGASAGSLYLTQVTNTKSLVQSLITGGVSDYVGSRMASTFMSEYGKVSAPPIYTLPSEKSTLPTDVLTNVDNFVTSSSSFPDKPKQKDSGFANVSVMKTLATKGTETAQDLTTSANKIPLSCPSVTTSAVLSALQATTGTAIGNMSAVISGVEKLFPSSSSVMQLHSHQNITLPDRIPATPRTTTVVPLTSHGVSAGISSSCEPVTYTANENVLVTTVSASHRATSIAELLSSKTSANVNDFSKVQQTLVTRGNALGNNSSPVSMTQATVSRGNSVLSDSLLSEGRNETEAIAIHSHLPLTAAAAVTSAQGISHQVQTEQAELLANVTSVSI